MDVDEFYRQPAAVPFKWEIKPGVPKNHHRLRQFPSHCPQSQHHPPPQKLKPPPSVSHFRHPPNSLRSSSRTRSDRWRFPHSNLAEPEQVSAGGCFPSRFPNRKSAQNVDRKPEPDYSSELESLSRWSVSSRKSISPFRYSVSSSPSSFSSYQSSPRPTSDSEWAGFGLFWLGLFRSEKKRSWALRDVGPVCFGLFFVKPIEIWETVGFKSRNTEALNPDCIVFFDHMDFL